jgi:hypothetical protein
MNDLRFPQNPSGIAVAFINSGVNSPEKNAGHNSMLPKATEQLQFGRQ